MSAFNPKVSVVIPVYNGANYMREAIDSALKQTYKNIEVLVINDGSKDNGETDRIAKSYGDKIIYIAKPNGGVATALNLGIEKMTGDYFSWLSHDDVYFENKVEHQVRHLEKLSDKNKIVFSDIQLIDEKSQPLSEVPLTKLVSNCTLYDLLAHQALHGCAMLVPKSYFKDFGNFDASLPTTQDYDLWVRMAKTHNFSYCPGVITKSREHFEQGSKQNFHRAAVVDFFNLHLKAITPELMNKVFPREERLSRYMILMKRLANLSLFSLFFNLQSQALIGSQDSFSDKVSFFIRSTSLLIYGSIGGKIKRNIPAPIKKFLKGIVTPPVTLDFTQVYKKNTFGSDESHSGEGSTMAQTEVIRQEIPKLLRDYNIRSFLDIPCGDFNWMRHLDLSQIQYFGADIVPDLVQKCREVYGNNQRQFNQLDLIKDTLPSVDLIFCRDCLVHMNYEDALKAIANMKKCGAKYLLSTTFTNRSQNENLFGIWRPLNLQLEPFNFPRPLQLINEACTEGDGNFSDKCLGLWLLSDL